MPVQQIQQGGWKRESELKKANRALAQRTRVWKEGAHSYGRSTNRPNKQTHERLGGGRTLVPCWQTNGEGGYKVTSSQVDKGKTIYIKKDIKRTSK